MKKSNGTIKRVRVENSSGNVFADLGLPHPEHELLKAKLTLYLYWLIKERVITQTGGRKGSRHTAAATCRHSCVKSGREIFPLERLMEFLTALGQDVEISVRPAKGAGRGFGGGLVVTWHRRSKATGIS